MNRTLDTEASERALEYVRQYYGVPADRGAAVKYEGKPGTIVGGQGPYIMIEFDGDVRGPFHPLWHIDYLDGIDHEHLFDAKINRFNERTNSPEPVKD